MTALNEPEARTVEQARVGPEQVGSDEYVILAAKAGRGMDLKDSAEISSEPAVWGQV